MKVIKYFNITTGTAMIRILQSETGIFTFLQLNAEQRIK